MNLSADQIMERIRKKNLPTNINNINYDNYTNYLTTVTIVPENNHAVETDIRHISFGKDSRHLPPNWRGVKWDLFRNPGQNADDSSRLKLCCNIIKQDTGTQQLIASLNSPHDRVWRKVLDRTADHWQLVDQNLRSWRREYGNTLLDFRVSKLAKPNREQATEIVVFLRENTDHYRIEMIYKSQLFPYMIPKDSREKLSIRQIQKNQIATLFVGRGTGDFADLDELGI